MSESEFWNSAPGFLSARVLAKQKEQREAISIARAQAYIIASTAGAGLKKGTTIQGMWPLPWERVKLADLPKIPIDELKAISDREDEFMKDFVNATFSNNGGQ